MPPARPPVPGGLQSLPDTEPIDQSSDLEIKGPAKVAEETRRLLTAEDAEVLEDEDYDPDYFVSRGKVDLGARHPNKQQASSKTLQPSATVAAQKFSKKINVEAYVPRNASHSVANAVNRMEHKSLVGRELHGDKAERATVEQVMDPRTRLIIFKMLNSGMLSSVNGCVSTGKEANVYHAERPGELGDCAIKVYKTSILSFKDRDKYVVGEYRFRTFCKSNPRKMVRTWAEKECRNLKRLLDAGIPCPSPIVLRQHVLVMDFIGQEGWPAPRLKDAPLDDDKWGRCYLQIIHLMREMYHKCKLVHADLSEYNILYFKGQCYIIDVSQAVEHFHPNALQFLRKDCANITSFFKAKLGLVMNIVELFNFVTDVTINEDNIDAYLDKIREIVANRSSTTAEDEINEAVFKEVHIVWHLDDEGADELTGEQVEATVSNPNEENSNSSGEESEGGDSVATDDGQDVDGGKAYLHSKPDDMSKQEWKKLVKQQNKEKRAEKKPKAAKKRREKVAKTARGKGRK
eukprot:TRINITY_DN883_c0_g1_i2.p1 TRINITY_DN883_c0_g1~~TRINITY_DN883_c0_g1_i2.p1  ORF type:complete len:517 (-),score=77.12 TRINITY_DN883_c0_g1_i2:32-1582(-)